MFRFPNHKKQGPDLKWIYHLISIGSPIVEIRRSSYLHNGISYTGKMTSYIESAPSTLLTDATCCLGVSPTVHGIIQWDTLRIEDGLNEIQMIAQFENKFLRVSGFNCNRKHWFFMQGYNKWYIHIRPQMNSNYKKLCKNWISYLPFQCQELIEISYTCILLNFPNSACKWLNLLNTSWIHWLRFD